MSSQNLTDALTAADGHGPLVGGESEDLNYTLLYWPAGHTIALHENDEVDVLMLCLQGSASVVVGEDTHAMRNGDLLLIPKGVPRSIAATTELAYLNVHKRRRKLQIQTDVKRPT